MKVNGNTRVYGLIGYPVKHTFSPAMHNAAFENLRVNAIYLAFKVKPRNLEYTIHCIKLMGIGGLNVTVPHKENVLNFIDEIEREARLMGAVNTIVNEDGKFKGFNTDGRGFLLSLKQELGIVPKGKRFFIIGAGGASRALSFSLALSGARRITLVDNVKKKAIELSKCLERNTSCEAIALNKEKRAMKELIYNSDVLINATPCGMKANDPRIIEPSFLHKRLVVCDVIYNPPMTRLLKDAKKVGIPYANGMGMLLHQGALSFKLWTHKKAPLDIMRKAVYKVLHQGS